MTEMKPLKTLTYPLFRVANLLNFTPDPKTPLGDLTLADFYCLSQIDSAGGDLENNIARRMRLNFGTMRPNIQRLENFGLIMRHLEDCDENLFRIRTTPYAKILLQDDGIYYRESFNLAMMKWDDKAITQMGAGLEAFIETFCRKSERGPATPSRFELSFDK
jgi:DNA-binding MarR family transcriptional regulator